MIRRIALAGAAGALALGALAASGIGGAGAAPPLISVATSATIDCSITAKAVLSPALKNSWDQQAHEPADGETNALVNAIPDTKFTTDGDNVVTSKAKSVACTGSATDGTNVATIVSVKISLGSGTAAVDNPPLQEDNTCAGLLAGTQPGDVAATYTSTITFKTSGAKLAPTTTSGQGIAPSGIGFGVTGGTVSGSLVGGTGKTQANLSDGATLTAVTAAPATSTNPVPTSNKCEATLKLKPTSATLKPPKGLKKIPIGQSFLDPSPAGASNLCLRKATGACP
jgi:hypothetical protein